MQNMLISISICVVLPIAIVLICSMRSYMADKERAKILIKVIESNGISDVDKIAELLKKPLKSPVQIMYGRLLRGSIYTLVGIVMLVFEACFYSDDSSIGVYYGDDWLLLLGGVSMAIGVSYLIVYFLSRREMSEPQ